MSGRSAKAARRAAAKVREQVGPPDAPHAGVRAMADLLDAAALEYACVRRWYHWSDVSEWPIARRHGLVPRTLVRWARRWRAAAEHVAVWSAEALRRLPRDSQEKIRRLRDRRLAAELRAAAAGPR